MAIIDNLTAIVINDDVTVTGTVDGVECTIHVWKSHIDQLIAATAGNAATKKQAVRQYIAAELKKQVPIQITFDLSGAPITL